MYNSLCEEYILSVDAIQDLSKEEDFEILVQGLMKANYGMDWEALWELVEWNIVHREDGDENRMDAQEERDIALSIVEDWLERSEVQKLSTVKERVIAFREYLRKSEAHGNKRRLSDREL